jgi:hypothetical protein
MPKAYAQAHFPKEDPTGTPMMIETTSLEQYQEALLGSMKEGGEKAMNMNKTSEVLQGLDESSRQSYEHLCEIFHLYIHFDPEATESQQMINVTFVGQSQGDIKQKLQKLK